LRNRDNASGDGISRRTKDERFTAKGQYSRIRSNNSRNNFAERGFSSPIFSNESVDFSWLKANRNIGERRNATVVLGHAGGDKVATGGAHVSINVHNVTITSSGDAWYEELPN
jgi:hypothetical protein